MFADVNAVSVERGKQVFSILFYMTFFLVAGPLALSTLLYLLFWTRYWWVSVAYATWWGWDVMTCNTGGRRGFLVPWVRGWTLWSWYRDYFPIQLVKTADLDPEKKYLICCHPHGILCFGAVCCFGSESCHFSLKFPGIRPHLTTIEGNLWMPMFRELFLCTGTVSSSRRSLNHLLSQPDSEAPVLLLGGVPEMDNCQEDEVILFLKKRKGFVKMALRHGACLVPTFSFGEAGLFRQPGHGLVRTFLQEIRKMIGIAPVIFFGRGCVQETFGILPQRNPVTVVVGAPIQVDKLDDPCDEDIDHLHEIYVTELKNLYKKYNPKFGDISVKLVIT